MNTPSQISDLQTDGQHVDVCFFISSLQGGGAEKVFIDLMRGMHGRGLAIYILVLIRYEGALKAAVPPGVRYLALGNTSSLWRGFDWCTNYLGYLRKGQTLMCGHKFGETALWPR